MRHQFNLSFLYPIFLFVLFLACFLLPTRMAHGQGVSDASLSSLTNTLQREHIVSSERTAAITIYGQLTISSFEAVCNRSDLIRIGFAGNDSTPVVPWVSQRCSRTALLMPPVQGFTLETFRFVSRFTQKAAAVWSTFSSYCVPGDTLYYLSPVPAMGTYLEDRRVCV